MLEISGKGFYIWKIPNCENGDTQSIANVASQAGLSHVLVKIANGIYDYNYDSALKKDLIAPLAEALHAKGISVWGWHYVFGDLPKDEAKAAIRQINKLPIDGYVIDAEGEYKDKYTPCRIFMGDLRNALPDFPIALSSYRYPKYHPQLPWKDFLNKCDYNMPQLYWEQAHNPREQLIRSIKEFQTIKPTRPYIPTGTAYASGDWKPTPQDVLEFMNAAVELGIPAVNFWSWDYCRLKMPELWQTISGFSWPGQPNPVKGICERYIDALNTRNIQTILQLYKPNAIHVCAQQTIQGLPFLSAWFSDLINNRFNNSIFSLQSVYGKEISKHFSWNVISAGKIIYQGEDTIGIQDGKIIYHYTTDQLE